MERRTSGRHGERHVYRSHLVLNRHIDFTRINALLKPCGTYGNRKLRGLGRARRIVHRAHGEPLRTIVSRGGSRYLHRGRGTDSDFEQLASRLGAR